MTTFTLLMFLLGTILIFVSGWCFGNFFAHKRYNRYIGDIVLGISNVIVGFLLLYNILL